MRFLPKQAQNSLRNRSDKKYISNLKARKKSNRIGRLILIDYEKDVAITNS